MMFPGQAVISGFELRDVYSRGLINFKTFDVAILTFRFSRARYKGLQEAVVSRYFC